MAIGLGNIAGAFTSSIPTSGSFSRTSLNAKAGCISKLSGLTSTLVICFSLLFLNNIFYWVPQCAAAAVVTSAVAGLVNISDFKVAWNSNFRDFVVMVVTFSLTLMIETSVGLFVGIILYTLWKYIEKYSKVERWFYSFSSNDNDEDNTRYVEQQRTKLLLSHQRA
jgi:MFS superfamily sulfate permease-like transporter